MKIPSIPIFKRKSKITGQSEAITMKTVRPAGKVSPSVDPGQQARVHERQPIPARKEMEFHKINITDPAKSFQENIDAASEAFLGKGSGPGKMVTENVTDPAKSFQENIDAASEAFLGKGSGPGKMVTENVTDPAKSFQENIDAVSKAFLGKGSGPGKMVTENVTDPAKSFQENLDAVYKSFPGIAAGTGKVKSS